MNKLAFAGLGAVLAVLGASGCGPAPGYERVVIIERPPPIERTGAWTTGPDDLATPFALGQRWIGKYRCAQGETDLVLTFIDVDGPELRALFTFDHPPSGAGGVFEMRGAWSVEGRKAALSPTAWVTRPPGYVMVGLRGAVTVDGRRFLGVVDGPGCTDFALRLSR